MVVHLGVPSSINVDCCSFVAATICPMQLSNDSTQLNVESFVAEKKSVGDHACYVYFKLRKHCQQDNVM